MALIYIDTNVFLDFYQAATDRLSIFKEIEKYSDKVVVTMQTFNEFRRNRAERLVLLEKEFAKSVPKGVHFTALIQAMEQFQQIDAHLKIVRNLSKEILNNLRSWREGKASDPVFDEFVAVVMASKLLKSTPEAISRAKDRKVLGRPPTSPNRHTIGDELIWETLLEGVNDDLIVVSRDKSFTSNAVLLKEEYKEVTKFELLDVTDSLSQALKRIGKESPKLEAAERQIAEDIEYDARKLNDACPDCGGRLDEDGYEGGDGDSAWWLQCATCRKQFFPK